MDAEVLYAQAEAALKGGFPQTAAGFLARLLRSNPRDERAWLLLASSVTDQDQVVECLHRVLAINPGNEQAKKLLKESTMAAFQTEVQTGTRTGLPPLGRYLVDSGMISPQQLEAALAEQRKSAARQSPRQLGEILVRQRAISARQLQEVVRKQVTDFYSLFEG